MKTKFFLSSIILHAVVFLVIAKAANSIEKTDSFDVSVLSKDKPQKTISAAKRTFSQELEKQTEKLSAEANNQEGVNEESRPATFDLDSLSGTADSDSEMGHLIRQLFKSRYYPSEALRKRQEGLVKLKFKVNSDGRLVDILLVEPSIFSELNKASVTALSRTKLDLEHSGVQNLFNKNYTFTFDYSIKN